MQHRLVILYRCFGRPYWSHLQGPRNPKESTEHDLSSLTQSSFFGLCPSFNFLKKHDVLKAGSVSVLRERSTYPGGPPRLSYS